MARKAQELTGVMVRLPEKLRRRLERTASTRGRSMNTEIIHRLEQSFAREAALLRTVPPLVDALTESVRALERIAAGVDQRALEQGILRIDEQGNLHVNRPAEKGEEDKS